MCHHREGPYHDCAYVDLRNSMTELAERDAARDLGMEGAPGLEADEPTRRKWGRAFLTAMDRRMSECRAMNVGIRWRN